MHLNLVAEDARRDVRSVTGALLYLEPSAARPYVAFTDSGPAGSNATFRPYEVSIRDARPNARDLSLDLHGFELVRHDTALGDFHDDEQVERRGRAEAAALVRAATGARRVHVFDHTRRRRAPGSGRQPSTRVHNDYTEISAPRRVRDLLGLEAEDLLHRRFAFINVWRPISAPAEDWPLALCDARSVSPEDLVATDIIYPGRRGEIYSLQFSPTHRWAYVPAMQLDEALLIKCYDSEPHVASITPHTAFADPTTPPNAPPRESIEFRTIAFFD